MPKRPAVSRCRPDATSSARRPAFIGGRAASANSNTLPQPSITSLCAPSIVYSSPERKAFETAGLIACALGLKVERASDLREHDRTNAGYLGADAFAASITRFFARPEELVFGRETATQAGARFAAAVRELGARTPNRDILLVTHGTVLTLYAAAIAGVEPLPFWRGMGMPAAVVFSLPDHRLLQQLQPPWPA